jgi:competence protein ComEC
MVVSALSFLAGLLLVQQLPVLPDIKWLLVGALFSGIMAWLRYWRCLFFVVGVLWAIVFATYQLFDRLSEHLEGSEIKVVGVIADLPEQDETRVRFDFIPMDGEYATSQSGAGAAISNNNLNDEQKLPTKLRLSWYYPDQPVKAGQHWAFTVKLKRVHGTLNPGGFDYERLLFTEGIGATGYVRPDPKPVLLGRDSAWNNITVWRQNITDRLTSNLGNSPSLALIKALTIGDGNSITQRQWDVFRKTGTTHLVVISGSHIGLIAGLVYFLVLKFWAWTGWLRLSPQKVAAVFSVLVGIFYSGLAGFSVPTQRSVIMLVIAMAAIVLQRNNRPFNTLAIALFGVLLFDPLSVLAVGFWLSFLAVSLIVYAVSGRLALPGSFAGIIKLNWVTSVGLSPLLLLFFHQVSVIAPFANMVAVPVISVLVVPLALVAVIIMFISATLAAPLFYWVDLMLQGLWWLLTAMADLSLATVNHAPPSYWALFFAVPGVLLLLGPVGIPVRWLSMVMFLPLVFTEIKKPETGAITMTLLDVGQGLSVVVQTSHHLLVYDTGAKFSEQSDIGQNVLLPFLRTQGVNKIDSLVISHGDNDHIGGAVSLMNGIRPGQVLTSVPQQLMEFSPVECVAGQLWQWDDVKFTMLSPQQGFASENDKSCVLKIQSDHLTVLLTGDIEAATEAWLVKTYGDSLKADIVVAPHHGSKTSSSIAFMQAIRPQYVLIPAGYRNQFGHPHKQVLANYQQVNAKWLNSADAGAITVNVKNGVLVVQGTRETESKYWNAK